MKKNNTWRKFKRNWKAETPKVWKWMAVTFASLSASAGVGLSAITTLGLSCGYEKEIGIFIGVTAFIAAFAKSQVKLPKKKTK